MINKELNCKWHFDPQAKGNEKGPNNPTALTFKGVLQSLAASYDNPELPSTNAK